MFVLHLLLSTIHPLNVVLVVSFQLLAFQFEGVSDQTSLWGPGLRTETDLFWDLEPFQFRWLEQK